jgi:cephalosporin hydroxylase
MTFAAHGCLPHSRKCLTTEGRIAMPTLRRYAGGLRQHARTIIRRGLANLSRRHFMTELVERTHNFGDVTWLGEPVWQNVLDLWVIQEAINELRPALIVETGTNRAGSAIFYANLFDLLGSGRVVTVDVERMHDRSHPRVEFLIGSSLDVHVIRRVAELCDAADGPIMVILDSDHRRNHVAAELELYAEFVTSGSLMLAQDGVIDELPVFSADRPGPLAAIHAFLQRHPEFTVDERLNRRFVVSHHPDGWLRRR